MRCHKICFNAEIWLIIPKLSLLPFTIWSTGFKSNFDVKLYKTDLHICGNFGRVNCLIIKYIQSELQWGIEENSKIIFLISQ